jgi:hypothetical protein
MLQARRSWVRSLMGSLILMVDSNRNKYQGYLAVGKGGLTIFMSCLEILGVSTSRNPEVLSKSVYLPLSSLHWIIIKKLVLHFSSFYLCNCYVRKCVLLPPGVNPIAIK